MFRVLRNLGGDLCHRDVIVGNSDYSAALGIALTAYTITASNRSFRLAQSGIRLANSL